VATTNADANQRTRNRLALFVLMGLLTVAGLVVLCSYLNRPPQMGSDEEVFKTVDALFTAVTARDEKLLGDCEQRLKGYRDEGKLPREAADALNAIIRQARSGHWESAAESLCDFMKVQRREGSAGSSQKTKNAKGIKGRP
jgi:hypothetical protein